MREYKRDLHDDSLEGVEDEAGWDNSRELLGKELKTLDKLGKKISEFAPKEVVFHVVQHSD